MGPPGSAMPSIDNDGSKKPSSNLKPAFEDGALKVMEEEFQVGIALLDDTLCSLRARSPCSTSSWAAIEAWTNFEANTRSSIGRC